MVSVETRTTTDDSTVDHVENSFLNITVSYTYLFIFQINLFYASFKRLSIFLHYSAYFVY